MHFRCSLANAGRFALLAIAVSWTTSAGASKIACVGDSITYGYNLTSPSKESYPTVLQTLLGAQHTVQNFGSSGCTLLKKGDKPYWNDAQFGLSDAFDPDVVVVMLGTNDAKPLNWSHQADFSGDYASMIDHYRGLGALVYVAVPPPVFASGAFEIDPAVLNTQIVPLVRQIAATANAPLIDVYRALDGKSTLFPDNVHPNAQGAQLIAQTVATALQQSGFGGAAGTGGAPGTGGLANSGGTRASGGAKSSGGSATVGGSTSSGGLSSAGGRSSGLVASSVGGNSGTGGSPRGSGGTTAAVGGTSNGSGGTTSTASKSVATAGATAQAGQPASTGGLSSTDTRNPGGSSSTSAGTASVAGAGGLTTAPGHTDTTRTAAGGGGSQAVGGSSLALVAQSANTEGCACHVGGQASGRFNGAAIALLVALGLFRRRKQR